MVEPALALNTKTAFSLPFALNAEERVVAASETHLKDPGALQCPVCRCTIERVSVDRLAAATFRHPASPGCHGALEEVLAGRAKQVLAEERELLLPEWRRASVDRQDRRGVVHYIDLRVDQRRWHYDSAAMGARYPGFKADVALYKDSPAIIEGNIADVSELIIEIKAVRGDNVFRSNLRLIHELRVDALEIDVSGATSSDYAPDAFAHYVTHRAPRFWMYCRAIEVHFERLNQQMLERYEAGMQLASDDFH